MVTMTEEPVNKEDLGDILAGGGSFNHMIVALH
jgi:hypothetical protein